MPNIPQLLEGRTKNFNLKKSVIFIKIDCLDKEICFTCIKIGYSTFCMKLVDSLQFLVISKIQIRYYARKVIRYRLIAKEIENIISCMSKHEILKENWKK